jgi:hypothetical protein
MGRRIQITEEQLKYIIENVDRIDEQGGQAAWEKRQQQTMDGIEKAKQGQADMQNKSATLAQAKKDGTTVVFQKYKATEPEVTQLPDINGNFYANYTSLDLGLMPNGLEQVKEDIENIKTYLTKSGYDLKNTTVTLYGSASSEPATNRHELDQHPKHNFGGKLPQSGWVNRNSGQEYQRVEGGNEFLAKSRATNIAKLVQQMIPGVKTSVSSKVEGCAGAECRRIKATVTGTKSSKDVVSTVRMTIGVSDQSGYWTTNEWNARHAGKDCKGNLCGCQIKNGNDTRKDGYVQSTQGQRGMTVGVNATGSGSAYQQNITYDWYGDGFDSYKQVWAGQKDAEGKKITQDQACAKLDGIPNITGKLHKKSPGSIARLLTTSAHFDSEGAQKVAQYFKRATPLNLNAIDPKNPFDLMRKDGVNLGKGITEENFQTFLKYCQKAGITVNPKPTAEQLMAAGAIVIMIK